jgi:hypothetical protein
MQDGRRGVLNSASILQETQSLRILSPLRPKLSCLGKPVNLEQKVECSKQLGRDFFSSASTIFSIFIQSSKD